MKIRFPITFEFKLITVMATQMYIKNSRNDTIGFVYKKPFKFVEEIRVGESDADDSKTLFHIKADRIIDFSATYYFSDLHWKRLGSISQQGMRSIWRASFEIYDANEVMLFRVKEKNPWIKALNFLMGEVPYLNFLTGYFFNPSYIFMDNQGKQLAELKKQATFLKDCFSLDTEERFSEDDTKTLLLGALMVMLLEGDRG